MQQWASRQVTRTIFGPVTGATSQLFNQYDRLTRPFGADGFGRVAEGVARGLGRPYFLVGQTLVVVAWIVFNAIAKDSFDPYPFILMNLAFSLQAAYAAPMILLAQTRDADRDRLRIEADTQHREHLAQETINLIEQNRQLLLTVEQLTRRLAGDPAPEQPSTDTPPPEIR